MPLRVLRQSEIKGATVAALLQTPWRQLEGINVCRYFLRLTSGSTFELQSQDPLEVFPIHAVRTGRILGIHVFPAEHPILPRDSTIIDLLTCEDWPTLGVLLESSTAGLRLLFCADSPWAQTVSAELVPPAECATSEILTYWDHICLSELLDR